MSDVQLSSESMASIDFGILDSEGLEALAKANNVPWAGLSRVQLVGALRKKILLSDDNGGNLMKTAASCTGALPQGADLGVLSGFMSQLMQSISLLVAEIGELKRFTMEKECEKDAAIAELREEVRILKQEATRPYDRTPCEYSSASGHAHQAQSHAQLAG